MKNRLRQIALFAGLEEDVLGEVAPFVEGLTFCNGDYLFFEGTDGDALYAIEQGAVQVSKLIDPHTGSQKVLATLCAGEIVGEMSLFDAQPRSATAMALGEVHTMRLTKSAFEELLKHDINTATKLMKSLLGYLSARLRKTNQELVTVYETGRILGEGSEVDAMCFHILDQLQGVLGAARGFIALYNEFSGDFELTAYRGIDHAIAQDLALNYSDPMVHFLTMDPRAHLVEHATLWNIGPARLQQFPHYGNTMVLAPLISNQHGMMGLLWFSDTLSGTPFTWNHRNLVEGVALQVGNAIVQAKMIQESAQRDRLAQARMQR